ncbi:MAG: carbohydrate ABC transporter permease [Clostridiaceae bacterium]|nr:carbohydrate ABC transporter permease [Clostridiaceae bacterium]
MKRRSGKYIRTWGEILFDILNPLVLTLFCISIIYPFWDMVVTSLSAPADVSYTSFNFWPKKVVTQGYSYCLNDEKFYLAFRNSIARTVAGTALSVFVTSIGAYVLTRRDMPLRKLITFIWVVPMFFGGGLVPTYLLYQDLGLLDNFLVYILPGAFSMYSAIIVRNFFFSIDIALEESAVIDGASAPRVLFSIYLPLSKPALATISLWSMVGHWNAWFDNMVYIRKEPLITLQYLLRRIIKETEAVTDQAMAWAGSIDMRLMVNATTIIAATTIITVIPILLVYPFLQRYFVKGIMVGSVKG